MMLESLMGLMIVAWAVLSYWPLLCAMAIILIVLCLYVLSLYRRRAKHGDPLLGHVATVLAWDGRDRRVEVFGAIWQAALPHGRQADLKPGDLVRVTARHDLTLTVISFSDGD